MQSVYDLPIGVARTNTLLRVTVIADEKGFETPLLLPVTMQELMGAKIDYETEEFRVKGGKSTPMHRLPTGHRAISVLEYDGAWKLPRQLMKGNRDPFQLPRSAKPTSSASTQAHPIKHRGVTVWVQQSDGQLVHVHSFAGPRPFMVQPEECFDKGDHSRPLTTSRVSFVDQSCSDPFVINDVWNGRFSNRALPQEWTGSVVFQMQAHRPMQARFSRRQ